MLQGVSRTARKRHNKATPKFLQGAVHTPQQCHLACAPASFIWCQGMIAVMPAISRAKGRADCLSQKCHKTDTLPTQFNGVIVKTQKCLDIVTPRGEPSNSRRDASIGALSPTSHRGPHRGRKLPDTSHPRQSQGTLT